jgi:hypothetical protein
MGLKTKEHQLRMQIAGFLKSQKKKHQDSRKESLKVMLDFVKISIDNTIPNIHCVLRGKFPEELELISV